VTAVDRDLSQLGAIADHTQVETIEADLEGGAWPLEGRHFDGIVVTNFLSRALLPKLLEALAEGGVLIYETFAVGQERFGKPTNSDFLLRPNELLDAFGSLEVVAFAHGEFREPKPAMRQRICALRPL
jgi:SAM-dependent methyltransferase